ncbi:hypothetical protein ACHWQZ_G003017 [Mnemiopsis leidyi]
MGRPSLEWSTLLWEGLRAQFNKPRFSDLKVNVQGDAVHVHRVVLATQSDALSELLPATTDNGIMNWSAHCNDINDAKDFLRSLYYGYAHVHQDNVLGLLKLAKIYNVRWLVEETENFAKTHLNHSNILEYLDFAVFYECEVLQEACSSKLFKFNKKYSLTRIAQPLVKTWLHITARTLSYIISNDRLCVEDEVEVFQYVMCWIEAGQRETTSPLTLIRYSYLPANFYALFALPYVMKVDPPLGTFLSESEISCPVFSADDLRKPSPSNMARFKVPRTYRYFRNDTSQYKEAVIQISEDFLIRDKFRKTFPMPNFTLCIDVDERVTISVILPKRTSSSRSDTSSGGSRARSKISTTILSNLDEETLELGACAVVDPTTRAPTTTGETTTSLESSEEKSGQSKEDGESDGAQCLELTSPTSQTSTVDTPSSVDNGQIQKPPIPKTDSGGSSSGSGKDTLFYCYCLSPSSRQPLALFRWWNSGGWHRTNFDMLIKQANGTLALGVIVVR